MSTTAECPRGSGQPDLCWIRDAGVPPGVRMAVHVGVPFCGPARLRKRTKFGHVHYYGQRTKCLAQTI